MRRRLAAEGIGSLLLAATVIGSGIMAERLAGGNLAVALIANTGATVAVLATLIALLGPVSGAHFNPAVSLVQALRDPAVIAWARANNANLQPDDAAATTLLLAQQARFIARWKDYLAAS